MIARIPEFIRFLFRRSRSMMLAMALMGVLSGLCSAAVLALINRVLQGGGEAGGLIAAGFAAIVMAKLITQVASQLMLTRFSQDTTLELSLTLCEKILRAPFRCTEEQGPSKLMVALSDDVSMLAWSIQSLPSLAMNAAVVAGCGVYLAWLSWPTFLLVVTATLLGAWGYQWLHRRAFASIYASREARTQLFKHFRSLTEGLKELLMHRDRRREFLKEEVYGAADRYRRTSIEASTHYAIAEASSHMAFYAMVGTILFVMPSVLALPSESLIGYVVVLLYMMSPIWGIIGTLPTVEKGQVAYDNIMRLGISLDESVATGRGAVALVDPAERPTVELRNVSFTYAHDAKREVSFSLGPIDFDLRPGELVFVIGGNGSGKSTFVKVLTGLYTPQTGQIRLGATSVTEGNREWYREHHSVVFSDFYLFEKLLGLESEKVATEAKSYLSLLQIEGKVGVKDRVFSTTDLSQGQRKRLALVSAYLEDRPIYVFDEWAADQDPEYKDIFYHRLLPDLRARGKSVVVITHDDRYFHLGDRVVKLEDGKMVAADAARTYGYQRASGTV